MTIISTLPPGSGAYVDVLGFVAGTETGGVITVWTAMISIYDSAQRHKYREFYRQMSSSQYLRETYRWRWRQGGQNSGYVMEHSPKLKIVNRKGA